MRTCRPVYTLSGMAWTTQQLTAIEEALAAGTTRVKYGDKEVEYRSLNELLRLRDMIRRELGLVAQDSTRIKAKFDKGL